MKTEQLFRNELKTLGFLPLNEESIRSINDEVYKEYIKVRVSEQNFFPKMNVKFYG